MVLHLIKYSIYNGNICRDLKLIGLLLGLQMDYTKHQCFLCPWDSRDDIRHYVWKDRPSLEEFFEQDLSCFFAWSHQSVCANTNQVRTLEKLIKAIDWNGNRFIGTCISIFSSSLDAKLTAVIFIKTEFGSLWMKKDGKTLSSQKKKHGINFA